MLRKLWFSTVMRGVLAWAPPWPLAQASAVLPLYPTSGSFVMLEGPGLPTAPSSPSEPHTRFWLIFFCSFGFAFLVVQVNTRPSPRPAGGSPTRQCGPPEGHHLWHPEGGVSGAFQWWSRTSLFPFWLSSPSSLFFLHLCFLCFPLTFAFVLLSSRSPESESSVGRKVSLVLEQLQPLVVSGLLMVGARSGSGLFGPPDLDMDSLPPHHPMSLTDGCFRFF